jgi:hypothetical protein
MVKVWLAPALTVTVPEGEILPLLSADAVIVNVLFTVIEAVPVLEAWLISPGYGAVTVIVPPAVPVKLTVQVALAPLPLSVQLALVGETPAPIAVTLNVPAGVGFIPAVVASLTVIVQLLACPTLTGVVQLTEVVLARITSIEAFPALVACVLSPP